MSKEINTYNFIDYIVVISFSFFINFYYSSIGVLPQDTFAYYDTGYRVLNGSVPFKDYWTVSGPFIDYLQALTFYIFGISWKSYIFSSSLLNSLVSIIFFYICRSYDLNRINSLFYSLCFSILANPSMGVPFPDHFSTFLSLIGIFLFLIGIKKEKFFLLYLVPICFFLAFFSKQSPAVYILIIFLVIYSCFIYQTKKYISIRYFFLGSLFCSIIFITAIYLNEIEIKQFVYQYLLFPQSIAGERLENYQFSFNSIFFQFKFIYIFLIPLIFISFMRIKEKNFFYDNKILYSFILILLNLVLIFHQIITKNFIFIFFLIPMLASVIHINFNQKFKFKKIISIFLISITFLLTVKYHLRFNENRKMLNLEKINLAKNINAQSIHQSLKGLKWITAEYSDNPDLEISLIKESIKVIENDKSKKMMLSGYLFFSSTIKQNLHNPSRWPSLQDASNPDNTNAYYNFYKKFIENLIIQKQIQTLYSTKDNQADIFLNIFDKKCQKTKLINDFLIKHDIKNCIN